MDILGRGDVLDEVARRLGEARLTTVTGPGGIGKTTIARAIARRDADRFPDGVYWVDLTVVDEAAEVGSAFAGQLGFGSFQALLDSPADRPALVVVDNCEHVLDAAAEAIEAILDSCDTTVALATSRSPLGMPGESVIVLGPLQLPGADGDDRGSPAVQLFLQRARDAGATIADGEIDAVGRLCRLLDGVPLAIELAAARSRVLSPTELLERLGDLDTLRRSRMRGPSRHRSVRDTIAWSLELLAEDDRRFFDRLAVLSGAFTADDAHAVAGDGNLAVTIDRLERLVADSLLSTSVIAGVTYHRQLELVRSYARERLVGSGGWDETWQRFVDRVTERSVELSTSAASGWDRLTLSTLLSRVEQHLAVLRWCLDRDEQPSRSFVLVATLWGVVHQGSLEEVAPLAERALERWDDPSSPGWADAAATVATCRYLSGRPQEAIHLARLALEQVGDAHYAPCTLRRVIAHSRVALGDLAGALEMLTEAIEVAADRVPSLAMEMRVSRAEVAATAAPGAQDLDELLSEVRAVAAEAAEVGSVVNEVWARSVEATLLARRDPARAREVATETLETARSSVYPAAESVNLHTLASLCVDDGDLVTAADLVRDLLDGLVARGASSELRNALRMAAVVLERSGRPAWESVAATALTYPVVSLFSIRRYYDPYFRIAAEKGTGIVVDTPTWRASLDWGARQGYDAEAMADVNRRAARFVAEVAARWPKVDTVVNGAIGPRGDGYVVEDLMSAAEATNYHAHQVEALAEGGADMVSAITMTYTEEAIGVARAASRTGIPVVISFTVETDGRLPSGQELGAAIEQTDAETEGVPAYYMVNCAHPTHFHEVLAAGGEWTKRIRGLRANASTLSHAELDEATELDRGDIADLADRYVHVRDALGGLCVIGGCCGTDHEHIAAIADQLI